MTESKHTIQELQQLQALPLDLKIALTKSRIRAWVNEFGTNGVYVSFSGGKDSTVLLRLVREEYPTVPAVFFDTGLEYPEIREFVKTYDNVEWVKPKLTFRETVEKYGYPIISKEVAECVFGARKYLKKVLTDLAQEADASTNERTNEHHTHTSLTSCADLDCAKRLRRERERDPVESLDTDSNGRSSTASVLMEAIKRAEQSQVGGGGSVRDFANCVGIRTADGRIDSRLYKSHRQLPHSASDGHPDTDRESDSGEHP